MSLRAFEGAAGRRKIQRLFCPALFIYLPHSGGYRFRVILIQSKYCREYDCRIFLKEAGSVSELAVLPELLVKALIRIEVVDNALYCIFHLSAVGSGVHPDPASDSAWDPGGELETLKAVLLGKS